MSDSNLVKIESKALEKLIDVVSSCIGTLYKPKAIRDQADAKAYEAITLGKANVEVTLMHDDAQNLMLERARLRVVATEIQHQKNIESIADKAIKYLGETVSEKPVDVDWKMRFFEKAKSVANEEMQEIWAKILASEIQNPENISLRTLTTVCNLASHEAKAFQKVCSMAFEDIYFLDNYSNTVILEAGDLKRTDIIVLKDCGLIKHDDDYYWPLSEYLYAKVEYTSRYSDTEVIITKINPQIIDPHFLMFTLAGIELSTLLRVEPNMKAFLAIQSYLKSTNFNIQLR